MNKINFQQIRGLETTLSDSFSFIRQNFVKVLMPTMTVAIWPLMIGTILQTFALEDLQKPSESMTPFGMKSNPYLQDFGSMGDFFPATFLIIVALLIVYIMINGYIKLYVSGKEEIGFDDLFPILKDKILPLFFYSIAIFFAISMGTLLCFLPGIYLGIVLFNFYTVAIIENTGFTATWKRCFELIKDEWWSTFALITITYLITIVAGMLVNLPVYSSMFMDIINNAQDPQKLAEEVTEYSYITTPISHIISIISAFLITTVTAFRYYTLVEIRKNKEGYPGQTHLKI